MSEDISKAREFITARWRSPEQLAAIESAEHESHRELETDEEEERDVKKLLEDHTSDEIGWTVSTLLRLAAGAKKAQTRSFLRETAVELVQVWEEEIRDPE